ncbi:hypothetical protein R1flu_019493 [Riccia fluitans]|uniref:Uncharacterized protein n=1 Tax=Riccia fluitans TaxID=41844 RepID=A0ABD1ZK96_9MARC
MCSSKGIVENRLGRTSGKVLSISSRNFCIHANGREEVLDGEGLQIGKWAGLKPGRAQRFDVLSAELRVLVIEWWSSMTRISPCAKRVLKRGNRAIHTLDIIRIPRDTKPKGGSKRYRNGQVVQGITEAEGGVTEPKAENMEAEEGVTEPKGEILELEAGNMEGEEGVTEAKGGITEA